MRQIMEKSLQWNKFNIILSVALSFLENFKTERRVQRGHRSPQEAYSK